MFPCLYILTPRKKFYAQGKKFLPGKKRAELSIPLIDKTGKPLYNTFGKIEPLR